jgi:hypothetical protein
VKTKPRHKKTMKSWAQPRRDHCPEPWCVRKRHKAGTPHKNNMGETFENKDGK